MLLTVLQLAVQFFWSSLFQRCYTGCLQKCECFSAVHLPAAFLIRVVRAQLGNFVTDCLAHLVHSTFRGWRQVKGSKQKPQLFESYRCGGDSGIHNLGPRPGLRISS